MRTWFAVVVVLTSSGLMGCPGTVPETDPKDAGADGPNVILDGGGEIPSPPNGESLCPTGVCNYQTGAGCADPEPACTPILDGQGAVVPGCIPAGTGKSGDACTQATDCAPGYLCANKACRKLCCGGDWTGCPTPNEHCIQNVKLKDQNNNVLETGAMVCLPADNCDPLAPDTCADPSTTCQIIDGTGASTCFPEGTGETGDPCPCKGGFICTTDDETGKDQCRRLCKAVAEGGEPSCPPGEGVCVHFAYDPPGVGECSDLVPQ